MRQFGITLHFKRSEATYSEVKIYQIPNHRAEDEYDSGAIMTSGESDPDLLHSLPSCCGGNSISIVTEVIWPQNPPLTVQSEVLSVTAEVEVSNTGAQIVNNTLHVVIVEDAPRYVQLLYTAQGKKQTNRKHRALVNS